jgi:hypothetical protein
MTSGVLSNQQDEVRNIRMLAHKFQQKEFRMWKSLICISYQFVSC